MPRVPSPQVQSRGLPVPQVRAASPAAFGAGLGEEIRQTGGLLAQFAVQEREKADTIRLMEFQRHVDDLDHDLVQKGALSKLGKDALPVYDETLKAWDNATGELVSGLSGERQKAAAAQMLARRRAAVSGTLQAHTDRETKRAFAEEAVASEQSAGNLAIGYATDPTRRQEAIQQGEQGIRASGVALGQGQSVIDLRLGAFRSNVHQGVIDRLLAAGQDQSAANYLEANRGQIDGSRLARAEKAVEDGSTTGQALRETDRITATASDLGAALAMVREIENPKVRQQAQAEVKQVYAERDAVARATETKRFQDASDLLETNGGSMPRLRAKLGATWLDLDQQSRSALEARSRQIQETAQGIPARTDSKVYTEFLLLPPAEMAKVDPLKSLRGSLSDGDYEQAVRQVAAARQFMTTGRDDSGVLGESINLNERALIGARSAGIIPMDESRGKWSEQQNADFDQFKQRLELALGEATAAKGGKLNPKEKQDVVDQFTIKVTLDRPWLKDKEIPGLTVPEDDLSRAYIPLTNLGDADREAIIGLIQSAGGTRTDRKEERIAAVLRLSAIGRLTAEQARAQMLAIATEPAE